MHAVDKDVAEDSAPHNSSYNGSHSANLTKDNKEDNATKNWADAIIRDAGEDHHTSAFWNYQMKDGG